MRSAVVFTAFTQKSILHRKLASRATCTLCVTAIAPDLATGEAAVLFLEANSLDLPALIDVLESGISL